MRRYLGVFAGVLYGTVYANASLAMMTFHPLHVAFARAFFGFLVVAGTLLLRRRPLLLPRTDTPFLLVLGFTGMAAYWIAINLGVQLSSSLQTALLANTYPIFVSLFTPLILRERVRPSEWLGILLGLTGAALVITGGRFAPLQGGQSVQGLAGGLVTLAGTAAFGFYVPMSRRYLANRAPDQMAANQLLWASVIMAPLLVLSGRGHFPWAPAPEPAVLLQSTASLLWVGLIATGLGILSFSTALKETTAMSAAIQMLISPAVATLLAAVILHEPVTPAALVGGVLIASAVLLSLQPPPSPAAAGRGQDPSAHRG